MGPGAPRIASPARMPLVKTGVGMTLDESHHIVIVEKARSGATIKLTLPAANAGNAGRTYVIRNVDVEKLSAHVDGRTADLIETKASLPIKRKTSVTLVADGEGEWRVINLTE
jgi:hypothetical protein